LKIELEIKIHPRLPRFAKHCGQANPPCKRRVFKIYCKNAGEMVRLDYKLTEKIPFNKLRV